MHFTPVIITLIAIIPLIWIYAFLPISPIGRLFDFLFLKKETKEKKLDRQLKETTDQLLKVSLARADLLAKNMELESKVAVLTQTSGYRRSSE